jgi:hypothetical protein
VQHPANDHPASVLEELQRVVKSVAHWQPLHEREQTEDASSSLVMEAQPPLPLGIELLWVQT